MKYNFTIYYQYFMKVIIGTDTKCHLTDFIIEYLKQNHNEVELAGGLKKPGASWVDSAVEVSKAVVKNSCDLGILLCWTGTGVTIAANKIKGIRAALCTDGENARGARLWNDANVLCMSIRLTSDEVAKEIIDAWLSIKEIDKTELKNINKLKELDK